MKFEELYQNGIYYMTIVNTNKCNLSCRYCFEQHKYNDIMDPELALKIIDKVYPLIVKDDLNYKFKLAFFGGEPLIGWESMKAMYDYLNSKELDYRAGLATNLTLLTDEMLDYWSKMDSCLTISIDGVADTHNKNRNNTFDIVSKNIDRVIEAGIDFELRMTCPFDQAHLLGDNVKYLHKRFGAKITSPTPDTIDSNISTKQINSFRDSFFEIADYYLENLGTDKEFNLGKYFNYLINIDFSNKEFKQKLCFYGNDVNGSISIDWNGNVVLCPDSPTSTLERDDVYGSIFEDIDFNKIFEKFHHVRNNLFREECKTCRCYGNICEGECYLYMTGDKFGDNKAACEIRRIYHDVTKYIQNRLK